MKKVTVILALQIILFSSCIDKILGHKYVATIDNARIMLEKSYAKEGLLEHFPTSISDKSVLSIMFSIPDTTYSPCSAEALLTSWLKGKPPFGVVSGLRQAKRIPTLRDRGGFPY